MTSYERWLLNETDGKARARVEALVASGRFVVVEEDHIDGFGTVWNYVADHATREEAQRQADEMNAEDLFIPARVVPADRVPLPLAGEALDDGEAPF